MAWRNGETRDVDVIYKSLGGRKTYGKMGL